MQQIDNQRDVYTIKALGKRLKYEGYLALAIATYDFATINKCTIISHSGKIENNIYKLSTDEIIKLKAFINKNIKQRKYRGYCIRSQLPTYKKFYSVYQYNRAKFAKIYKRLGELALKLNNDDIFNNVSPYRVLNLCITKKDGIVQYIGDEKHIFRIRSFQNITEQIALLLLNTYDIQTDYATLNYLKNKGRISFYYDDEGMHQAELTDTIFQPLRIRIRANIELLKLLRNNIEIEDAVYSAIERTSRILKL